VRKPSLIIPDATVRAQSAYPGQVHYVPSIMLSTTFRRGHANRRPSHGVWLIGIGWVSSVLCNPGISACVYHYGQQWFGVLMGANERSFRCCLDLIGSQMFSYSCFSLG
jgi:hypothetical protein